MKTLTSFARITLILGLLVFPLACSDDAVNNPDNPNTGVEFYVSASTGDDDNPGSRSEPFATIAKGISEAANAATKGASVFVSNGIYTESPVFADSIKVFGSYDPDSWTSSGVTTINVGTTPALAESLTSFEASDFLIRAQDNATPGGNSIALRAINCGPGVTFDSCTFEAGDGGTGATGEAGWQGLAGLNGTDGTNGCDGCSSGGFGAIAPPPHGGAITEPGNGGRGGFGDAAGEAGVSGAGGASGGDGGNYAGLCFVESNPGSPGTTGSIGDPGAGGSDATAGGQNIGGMWVSNDGGVGNPGLPGAGGGGGGGGGGGSSSGGICNSDRGGGGGSGGGGGRPGQGGLGGQGGGASFAVYVSAGEPVFSACSFIAANGGDGGPGGVGGIGGAGGPGGSGGNGPDDSGPGGVGGDGGQGGPGGGGQGGPGGPSWCIYKADGALPSLTSPNCLEGTAGTGGDGGAEGDGGPLADPGPDGTSGTVGP